MNYKKEIILNNRNKLFVGLFQEHNNKYVLRSQATYYNYSILSQNKLSYIDPEGGPFIHVDDIIDNKKVIEILLEDGRFKIILE